MTQLHVHAVSATDTGVALSMLDTELEALEFMPRMIFAFYGCDHDDHRLHQYLSARYPQAALLGGSSSGGFMTQRGLMDQHSIGLLLIDDGDGYYGVAADRLGVDPATTAELLVRQALSNCNCTGELPELIWIYQAPGREEAVIEGLRRVVGDSCPIVGGSSADNDLTGRWRQFGPDGPMSDGLAVGVLMPSSSIGYAFQGGYEPSGPNGIVTGIGFCAAGDSGVVTAGAGREILSIDNEPAADVYNRWLGGRIDAQIAKAGPILSDTTMFPLATEAGQVDGVSHFLLIHPESVTSVGGLRTFCDIEVGSRVYAMKGDRQRLIDRAGRVAAQALRTLPAGHAGVAGGIVVYCGGCKMAIGDDIPKVSSAIAASLGEAPFIGCFTFGEQGQLIDRNVHGNLMISAVVFAQ